MTTETKDDSLGAKLLKHTTKFLGETFGDTSEAGIEMINKKQEKFIAAIDTSKDLDDETKDFFKKGINLTATSMRNMFEGLNKLSEEFKTDAKPSENKAAEK